MLIFNRYVTWVSENLGKVLAETKKSREFNYKIVDWEKGDNVSDDKLIINVVGTNINIPLKPGVIYADDQLIKGFHPLDVKIISTLALSCEPTSKYQLLLQDFRSDIENYTIVYGHKNLSKKLRISVDDLARNMTLIDGFSPQDAFKIGETFAENKIRNERKIINAMKKIFR